MCKMLFCAKKQTQAGKATRQKQGLKFCLHYVEILIAIALLTH